MPLQNRVLATGEIISHPARGLFMGNRGILHDDQKTLGRPRWRHKAWVTCVLKHKDWHRPVMRPGNYTELFFLDEAVALAAGHRPCALCRRAAYINFLAALNHQDSAKSLDAALHATRVIPRTTTHIRHETDIATLPPGAIIWRDTPLLVTKRHLLPVTANGYGNPKKRPTSGKAIVLTPSFTISALREGYRPHLHPSAQMQL